MFNYYDWHWYCNENNKYWSSKQKIWLDHISEDEFTKIETIDELNKVFYAIRLWELAPTPSPQIIKSWQGKCVLSSMGYYDAVEAYINTSSSQAEKIAFLNASDWHRDSTLIIEMATMLNLSSTQIDAMFIVADELTI